MGECSTSALSNVESGLADDRDLKEQVLVLATGCDATQLDLSAAEGYLLSRIDGATAWRFLREIGGIPPEDVDACLGRWLSEGVLEVVPRPMASETSRPNDERDTATSSADAGEAPPSTDAEAAPTSAPEFVAPAIDETQLDEALDINVVIQRRILEFEASLGRPYHELLGIEVGSDPKAVKRAYFKLSKEFHPDRYFRKQIGGYAERLDRIFKKVLEAHEILSDPELCKVENQPAPEAPLANPTSGVVDAASVPPAAAADPGAGTSSPKPVPARPLTKLERLKQRMPFKINHAALAERRARADEIFRAAENSQKAGRLQEAEASLRIAITFDPGRAEFKEALGSLRIAAAGARATQLLAKPSERMSSAELLEALRLLEDVLPYRPHDPELNERAARVCLQLPKLDDAEEYAGTLLLRSPEYSPAHTLLGRIHRERGDMDQAVRAFEMALKFDEEDLEARRALASVRIGARDAARGGDS